jgi:hypothetical protein
MMIIVKWTAAEHKLSQHDARNFKGSQGAISQNYRKNSFNSVGGINTTFLWCSRSKGILNLFLNWRYLPSGAERQKAVSPFCNVRSFTSFLWLHFFLFSFNTFSLSICRRGFETLLASLSENHRDQLRRRGWKKGHECCNFTFCCPFYGIGRRKMKGSTAHYR